MEAEKAESATAPQHAAFPRLEAMWRAGRGCDVTIMCKDNKAIKAHSLVLCSVSDKLDELLLLNADKIINSLEVEAETWEALLEVIYTGRHTNEEQMDNGFKLENMASVAKSLGMDNIVNLCECMIKDTKEKAIQNDSITEETSQDENFEFMDTVGKETEMLSEQKDEVVRIKKCFHCRDKCRAKRVKCFYCFRIVDNDILHMVNCHPFTPATSMFAYSCRFIANDSTSKEWTIFTKILATQEDEHGMPIKGFLYKCQRCDVLKTSLDDIMKHSNTDHGISAKVCKVCHTGFLRNIFVKDHENFCKGGDLIKCDECGKEVGGFHALWSHMAQHRHQDGVENNKVRDTNESTADNEAELMELVSESSIAEEIQDKTPPVQTDRKKMCVNCEGPCQNKWVKCVYCDRIVSNSTRHMDHHHPFTPHSCLWVYYCKYKIGTGDHSKISHVCSKEAMIGESSNSKYVCQKCKVSYRTLNMINKHLKVKHNIYRVHHCPICDMGFTSSYLFEDHKYFCQGGDLSSFTPSQKELSVDNELAVNMSSCDKDADIGTQTFTKRTPRRSIKKPVRFRGTVSVFDENEIEDKKSDVSGNIDNLHMKQGSTNVLTKSAVGQSSLALVKKQMNVKVTSSGYDNREETLHQINDTATSETVSFEESIQRKSICTCCGENCDAKLVRCLYCMDTIEKDLSHMEKEHPFTPAGNWWVFTCNPESLSRLQEEKECLLVFKKELFCSGEAETEGYHYQCKLCNQLLGDCLEIAASHMKQVHLVECYVCSVCDTGFSMSSAHKDHEYLCKGGNVVKCDICSLYFCGIENLMEHQTHVHKEEVQEKDIKLKHLINTENEATARSGSSHDFERVLSSDANLNETTLISNQKENSQTLKRKVKVEENTDFINGVCSHCSGECEAVTVRCLYCFKVVDKDITHKEIGHPHIPAESTWVFTCQIDKDEQHDHSMIFIKESVHKKPSSFRKSNRSGKTERFKCLQCDNNFTSLEILLKHVVHQFRCLKCKLIFTNKDSVHRHVELMHNQTSYGCESCESGFLDESTCEDHSYLCSGGGVMTCPVCVQVFWRVSEFNHHSKQCQPLKRMKLEDRQQESGENARMPESEGDDNDAKDPTYTVTEEALKKRGRGRPRKGELLTAPATVSVKKMKEKKPLTDEDLKVSLCDHFEEVHTERVKAHQKMCLFCEGNCLSGAVKCGYCGCQVKSSEMENHMVLNHPMIPATSLWFVTCRCYRVSNQMDHLARQIIEQQQVKDENNLIEDGVYMSLLAGYECVICDQKFTGDDILQHLEGEHKIESFMCDTCGVIIRLDGKINVHDHKHICAGGDILKCKDCDKRFASWQSANKHRKLVHMEPQRKRRSARSLAATKIVETQGEYGYVIKCVDCNGTCHTGDIKCGLCQEIVPKNDIHMKEKHAYSPSTSWVVTCRYSLASAESQVRSFAGGKVPVATEAELLEHPSIPCTLSFHYKCFWCDAVFSNRKQFKDHIRLTHFKMIEYKSTGLVTYHCKYCEAVLIGRSYFFSDHVLFCSKGDIHQCEQCNAQFCSLQKMHLHCKKKHPEVLERKRALKAAAIRSNGKVAMDVPAGTVFQCAECSFSAENLTLLKRHNRLEHNYRGGQLNQVCRFCFKVFRVRSDKERHEQTFHLGGQEVVCHICGQSYEIPNQLERHMYYYHKGGREYLSIKQKEERKKNVMKVCGYCGKEYTIAAKLNRHIRVFHEKSLEFKCSICMKEYGSRDSLRIHENKHKGNKTYSCPYCTYKDYRGYIVNSHVEREHPGREKPYKRVSVFHPEDGVSEGEEEELGGVGREGSGFEKQLVIEYVKASDIQKGVIEEYHYEQPQQEGIMTEVIQLQDYTIEDSEQHEQQFVQAVQQYEVQQQGQDVEISHQQIEVKEIAVDNLEEVSTAEEVLVEYYVT